MESIPPHIQAAARWLELGWTNARNPVHDYVYQAFFRPFGIECEFMLCDPATATSPEMALPSFQHPKWSRDKVHEDIARVFPHPDIAGCFELIVMPSGLIASRMIKPVSQKFIPLVDEFAEGRELLALIQQSRVTAARFIQKAFEAASLPDADPVLVSEFLADPGAYSVHLMRILTQAGGSGPR